MAGKQTGGGSILLKILIAVLIVVLYFAVEIPSRQWEQQEADQILARKRLTNLNTATLQYLFFNRKFPDTFEDLKASLDTCRLHVPPLHFIADQKQMNPDAARDSILISAEDTMRVEAFTIQGGGRGLSPEGMERYHTRIWAKMKPQYDALGTDTLHLWSDSEIKAWPREYGEMDFSLWASSPSRFERYFTPGDSAYVEVTRHSFALPFETIFTCPSTGKPFEMQHVAKYSYSGEYLFELEGEEGESVSTVARQQAFFEAARTQVANGIAERFQALTDSAKAAGNAQFQVPEAEKNKIVVEEVSTWLAKMEPGQKLAHSSERSHTARADSASFYTADRFVEDTLFPEATLGSRARQHESLMALPAVSQLVSALRVGSELDSVRIDTVGTALYSPIEGDEVYMEGFMRIFEVDPPENHGYIYNGTTSWE